MKSQVIISIMSKAAIFLSREESLKLRDVLDSEFRNLEIRSTCTDLVPYTGVPITLKYFLSAKELHGMAASSLSAYSRQLTKFLATLQKRIEDITDLDCRAYLSAYRKSGASMTTTDTLRSILHSFFDWCEINRFIQTSPMKSIERFKLPKRLPKFLTKVELEKLRMACITKRERALLEVFYSSACRVSEIFNLNREDIDFGTGMVRVIGKGDKERIVSLTEQACLYLYEYLSERRDNDTSLFVTDVSPHRRLSISAIQEAFSKIGKRSGVIKRIHPHLMRHTRATALLSSNVSIDKIRQALGHVNVATSLIYANTQNSSVQSAMRETS